MRLPWGFPCWCQGKNLDTLLFKKPRDIAVFLVFLLELKKNLTKIVGVFVCLWGNGVAGNCIFRLFGGCRGDVVICDVLYGGLLML